MDPSTFFCNEYPIAPAPFVEKAILYPPQCLCTLKKSVVYIRVGFCLEYLLCPVDWYTGTTNLENSLVVSLKSNNALTIKTKLEGLTAIPLLDFHPGEKKIYVAMKTCTRFAWQFYFTASQQ